MITPNTCKKKCIKLTYCYDFLEAPSTTNSCNPQSVLVKLYLQCHILRTGNGVESYPSISLFPSRLTQKKYNMEIESFSKAFYFYAQE